MHHRLLSTGNCVVLDFFAVNRPKKKCNSRKNTKDGRKANRFMCDFVREDGRGGGRIGEGAAPLQYVPSPHVCIPSPGGFICHGSVPTAADVTSELQH